MCRTAEANDFPCIERKGKVQLTGIERAATAKMYQKGDASHEVHKYVDQHADVWSLLAMVRNGDYPHVITKDQRQSQARQRLKVFRLRVFLHRLIRGIGESLRCKDVNRVGALFMGPVKALGAEHQIRREDAMDDELVSSIAKLFQQHVRRLPPLVSLFANNDKEQVKREAKAKSALDLCWMVVGLWSFQTLSVSSTHLESDSWQHMHFVWSFVRCAQGVSKQTMCSAKQCTHGRNCTLSGSVAARRRKTRKRKTFRRWRACDCLWSFVTMWG
ncbi:hypothetical protein sr16736 [Sporisorium reilianum SRZ2]|uniref:Uncharacterized protein n=1 Tax=Sporisorium reilianum (strain SRZ2) TaxID=999809 RepID=E6ZVS0_SPORE|nr:hypothetical protein sr16736 [Sporisorium reilianum SRZ2]